MVPEHTRVHAPTSRAPRDRHQTPPPSPRPVSDALGNDRPLREGRGGVRAPRTRFTLDGAATSKGFDMIKIHSPLHQAWLDSMRAMVEFRFSRLRMRQLAASRIPLSLAEYDAHCRHIGIAGVRALIWMLTDPCDEYRGQKEATRLKRERRAVDWKEIQKRRRRVRDKARRANDRQ